MSELEQLLARVVEATADRTDLALYDARASLVPKTAENADWIYRWTEFVDARAYTDAALALVERVLPGWDYGLDRDQGQFFAVLSPEGATMAKGFQSEGRTITLAILTALLKALIARTLIGERET